MTERKQPEILEDRRGRVVRAYRDSSPWPRSPEHPEHNSGEPKGQSGTGGHSTGLPSAGPGGPHPHIGKISGNLGQGAGTPAVAYRLFPQPYRNALDIKRSTINHEGETMSPERKADGLAEGMAESFFKLIGARKSPHNLQQLKDSLKYISRDYDLKLEDERGNLYGKAEVQKILEHWQGIRDIPTKEGEKSSYAVSRHAIISVPAGSDVDALRDSVRELAAEVFTSKGFELFWTVHEHNDDHPNEPDHPHAHLIINAMSRAGKPCKSSRLNLRKADLQHIRERFAFIAREHGIELNATSRTVRGQHGAEHLKEKMFKQNDRPDMQNSQTTEREQEKTRPNDHSKSTKRRQRAYLARDEVIANCREWGETLLKSTDPADKKRGAQLLAHADRMERQREAELKLDRDLQKVSEQEKGKEQNERTTKATSSRSALKYPQQDQNTKHNDNARTREAIRKRKAHERDIREGRATYTEGELKKQRYAQYIREKRERARRQQDQELQR